MSCTLDLATCKVCNVTSQEMFANERCPVCKTCASCDVVLTPANEANDRDADFWIGQKRDRYCIDCADRLSEAQADHAFNLRYSA